MAHDSTTGAVARDSPARRLGRDGGRNSSIARSPSSRALTFEDHDASARITQPAKKTVGQRFCEGIAPGLLGGVRGLVSKKKRRFTEDGFDLDLTYITPNVIAMGFPSSGREGLYRNPLPEVQRFFELRHPGRYRIYNLCSERAYDGGDFLGRVARFPFDDHNPSQLEVIPRFCADAESWLSGHPDNVIAIHCKAGKGRTGMIIACYLLHCGFRNTAEGALRWFGNVRTANGKGVTIPSQMRFVHYYEQMLRHGAPRVFTYQLTRVRLRGVPNPDKNGVCAPHFVISCDGEKTFELRRAVLAAAATGRGPGRDGGLNVGADGKLRRYRRTEPYVDFDLTCLGRPVLLRGNVKVQFLHERPGVVAAGVRHAKLCHLWFHTGFVSRNYLVFAKAAIDKANKDKKGTYPPNFALEFFLHRVPLPGPLEYGRGSDDHGN